MNKPMSELVYPVIRYALQLKERLDREDPESIDIEAEQRELLGRIHNDAAARRAPDYLGDGQMFLGVRYALACWLDELFIVHSSWSNLWNERKLEVHLYDTLERAGKFWDQADLVLGRPGTPKMAFRPGPDAIEAFFLFIVLGFRGKFLNNPAKIREYVEDMRLVVAKTDAWEPPRDIAVKTNIEPLEGRELLQRTVWVYGGIAVMVLIALLILYQFLRA